MANQVFQLVVRTGPRPGQIYPLELDVLNIGRDPLSDIVLDDSEVSRHHARLTRTAAGYELQDMGSTNGSFVDGQRLSGKAAALKPGQVVMLGSNVTLVYQALEEHDPMATVVAPAADIFASTEKAVAPVEEVVAPVEEALVEEQPFLEEEAPVVEAPVVEAPVVAAVVEEAFVEEAEPVEIEEDVIFTPVPDADDLSQLEDELQQASEESSAEDEDFTATMIDDIPQFEEIDETPEPEVTPLPEELPAFAAQSMPEEPEMVPQEPEELPAFEAPSMPEEPAMAPSEPESLSTFEAPPPEPPMREPERFPEFAEKEDATVIDTGEPLQGFDLQPTPPPVEPEIVSDGGQKSNRNRNLLIAVVAAILLCCFCLIVVGAAGIASGYFTTGF